MVRKVPLWWRPLGVSDRDSSEMLGNRILIDGVGVFPCGIH